MGQVLETEGLQDLLGRQVLAERHQPVLVVDAGDDQPGGLGPHRDQAVEIDRVIEGPGRPVGAQEQGLAGRQRMADGGLGPTAGRQQLIGRDRHGALGPDHHVRAPARGAGGEVQIAAEYRAEVVFVVLGLLLHVGLNDADDWGAGARGCDRMPQPQGAPSPQDRQCTEGAGEAGQSAAAVLGRGGAGECGRRRQGQPGEAIGADQAGRLRHRRSRPPGLARQVPGKTGEQMAPHPLQRGQGAGEDQHAQHAARGQRPVERHGCAPEQSQPRRQQGGGDGRHPSLAPRVDHEGLGHPPAPDQEVGEGGQPAAPESRTQRPGRRRGVHQVHEQGVAEQSRQEAKGRVGDGCKPARRQRKQGGGLRPQPEDHASAAFTGRGPVWTGVSAGAGEARLTRTSLTLRGSASVTSNS